MFLITIYFLKIYSTLLAIKKKLLFIQQVLKMAASDFGSVAKILNL